MSSTSKHALYGKEETTAAYGVYAGGALRQLRYTSFDLTENITYTQSSEIDPSRQPTDQVKTDSRVTGSMGFELSYDSQWFRMLKRLMLYDTDITASVTASLATVSFSEETNSIDDLTGTLYFVTGDWIRVTDSPLNGTFIAKAAVAYISGTFTTYTATLTAVAGVTLGTAVTGGTSGATGTIRYIDTGAPKTYTIQVVSGTFVAGETVARTDGAAGSITAITITASGAVLSGKKIIDEAAVATIEVKRTGTIAPGATARSWTFEGVQGDLASSFEAFYGCMFTSMSMTVPAKGAINGSFGLKGKNRAINAATIGTGTPTAPQTRAVMNSESNFYGALMGGGESVLTAMTATSADATTICTTSTPHGLQTGDLIVIHGNSDTDNNRNWLVTRITTTTFSLQDSTAQTAQTGSASGYFRKLKVAKAVVDANFTIDNQLREETQLGVSGITAQPIGTLTCTGGLNLYYSDSSEQLRYHDDEYTSLALVFNDTTTDPSLFIVFEFPRIKYVQNPAPINGNNESRVNAVQWAASKDPVEGTALRACFN